MGRVLIVITRVCPACHNEESATNGNAISRGPGLNHASWYTLVCTSAMWYVPGVVTSRWNCTSKSRQQTKTYPHHHQALSSHQTSELIRAVQANRSDRWS